MEAFLSAEVLEFALALIGGLAAIGVMAINFFETPKDDGSVWAQIYWVLERIVIWTDKAKQYPGQGDDERELIIEEIKEEGRKEGRAEVEAERAELPI